MNKVPDSDLTKYMEIKKKTLWTSDELGHLDKIEHLLPEIITELMNWRDQAYKNFK